MTPTSGKSVRVKWRRVRAGLYEHVRSGIQIQRDGPDYGHYGVWTILDRDGGTLPTLRDAKTHLLTRLRKAASEPPR